MNNTNILQKLCSPVFINMNVKIALTGILNGLKEYESRGICPYMSAFIGNVSDQENKCFGCAATMAVASLADLYGEDLVSIAYDASRICRVFPSSQQYHDSYHAVMQYESIVNATRTANFATLLQTYGSSNREKFREESIFLLSYIIPDWDKLFCRGELNPDEEERNSYVDHMRCMVNNNL